MRSALLLALALGGCSPSPQILPSSRYSDGTVYLSPDCVAHLSEVRSLPVVVEKVPRSNVLLASVHADGRWFPGKALVRADLVGWAAADVEDHERCHQWTFLKTGNPQFHR